MAETNNQPSQKKNRGTVCSKKSTKVDLTPMVDLGFILITFFIFTAALQEAKAMTIMVPNDKDISVKDPICESCALTFVLGKNNHLYYYEGKEEQSIYQLTNYSPEGLRQMIMQKRKKVIEKRGSDDLVLIIKPSPLSSFKNLVDVVDECSISLVKRYYIDEPTAREISKIPE